MISKIFESVLILKYGMFLNVNDNLVLEKNVSCSSAILRNVIEYFNEQGSSIYLASLGASNAFDRVNHFQLCQTLMRRHLPVAFLSIIINRYIVN